MPVSSAEENRMLDAPEKMASRTAGWTRHHATGLSWDMPITTAEATRHTAIPASEMMPAHGVVVGGLTIVLRTVSTCTGRSWIAELGVLTGALRESRGDSAEADCPGGLMCANLPRQTDHRTSGRPPEGLVQGRWRKSRRVAQSPHSHNPMADFRCVRGTY